MSDIPKDFFHRKDWSGHIGRVDKRGYGAALDESQLASAVEASYARALMSE